MTGRPVDERLVLPEVVHKALGGPFVAADALRFSRGLVGRGFAEVAAALAPQLPLVMGGWFLPRLCMHWSAPLLLQMLLSAPWRT